MMERSFSIMDDDEDEDLEDEEIVQKLGSFGQAGAGLGEDDEEVESAKPKLAPRKLSNETDDQISRRRISSPGSSARQIIPKPKRPSSTSDDSDADQDTKILGEYDPKQFDNLQVNSEIKDIFQYITKYIPQQVSLDNKFKPFVPEYLPAVGDIDAFLKVIAPTELFSGENFDADQKLGLVVLDEPAANQSDSALLHLQLRAESVSSTTSDHVVVKKVDNVEKNAKTIDKWIKDISALHKSKSSPSVRYSEPMPDLDELMQEWPEDLENQLRENNFPKPTPDVTIDEYIERVCGIFQIPVKNKIESLHLLFSLFAAVKSSQLFKSSQMEKVERKSEAVEENATNQLVLE